MSSNLRDQRIRVYGYVETGAEGMPGTSYVWQETAWGRKSPASAREVALAAQAQHEVDWVFVFGDSVGVPTDGVLKHGGTFYKVTGVYLSRRMNEVVVHTIEAGDEVYDNVSEPVPVLLIATGLTNDWNMVDQSGNTIKDVLGGAHAPFGPVAPSWEAAPPMLRFPTGASNVQCFAESLSNAMAHSEEYSLMGVLRLNANGFGGTPAYISIGNQDADATLKFSDRVNGGGSDATALQFQSAVNPGPNVQVIVDETPAYPRYLSFAHVVHSRGIDLHLDGVLAAHVEGRGYIRQGIKATIGVAFGKIFGVNAGFMRDVALGRHVRYVRPLTGSEVKHNHNVLRITYPGLVSA